MIKRQHQLNAKANDLDQKAQDHLIQKLIKASIQICHYREENKIKIEISN